MDFFGLRYFGIKTSYELFEETYENPSDLFIESISDSKEVPYYNKKYTIRFLDENKDYMMGYLLKSKETNLIVLNDELFEEDEFTNWEKLLFIIDIKRQLFICQHKTQVATPENVHNVLHKLANNHSKKHGYEIKLEYLVDKFKFWEIIENSEGLYQIAFNLNAPNLFGGSKKANSWLKTLKAKHNMSSVQVGFRNENGELKYEEEELESYRDYADGGGGNWTLGIIKEGRKKRYNSSHHIKQEQIDLETDNPKYIKENLSNIRQKLIQLINKIDDLNV